MKLHNVFLVLVGIGVVAAAAYVSKEPASPGMQMVEAADKFVATLNDEQKSQALFPFDSEERTNWHFIPMQNAQKQPTRKGLRLELMKPEQKKAALDLLRAGTSESGYTQAVTIMSLESILNELEKGGNNVRSPEWYFVSIFGTPSSTGRWGWRIEGHHLSLNFTIDKGRVIGSTPAFFGANPADDPKKGRTLAKSEDLANQLFGMLNDEQKKVAARMKHFEEIEQGKAKPGVGQPVGLPAGMMDDKQRQVLTDLIEAYAARMPPEVAAAQLEDVKKAGLDKVHFGFVQEDKPGKPTTYRVQGPTFVIEFLNVQADSARNPANHIHSSWRNIQGDFGL
jgi:hypothetical protein